MSKSLIAALRRRGETARLCSFKCDFYALPLPAQDALHGLASLVEDAADEIERLAAKSVEYDKHVAEFTNGA